MARPLAEGPELEVSGASRAKQVAATFRKRKRKCPAQALGWAGFPVCPLRHRKRRGARGRPSECEPAGGVAEGGCQLDPGFRAAPQVGSPVACRTEQWGDARGQARVSTPGCQGHGGVPRRGLLAGLSGAGWSAMVAAGASGPAHLWSRLPEVLTPRTSLLGPSVWRGVWKRGLPPKAPRSAGSDLRAVQAPGAS